MDAVEILSRLSASGVELQTDGKRLRYRAAIPLSPDLHAALEAKKPVLIGLLQSRELPESSPAWSEGDALVAQSFARLNAAHPVGCPVNGPEWDRREALVDAAAAMRSLADLHAALAEYEHYAQGVFAKWLGEAV